jgi:hypothetical protein
MASVIRRFDGIMAHCRRDLIEARELIFRMKGEHENDKRKCREVDCNQIRELQQLRNQTSQDAAIMFSGKITAATSNVKMMGDKVKNLELFIAMFMVKRKLIITISANSI